MSLVRGHDVLTFDGRHGRLGAVEREHRISRAATIFDPQMTAFLQKLDGPADLPIAHWVAVGAFDVAGYSNLAGVDIADVEEAVEVDDQAGDLSGQPE